MGSVLFWTPCTSRCEVRKIINYISNKEELPHQLKEYVVAIYKE
jgi:hypothetical protein